MSATTNSGHVLIGIGPPGDVDRSRRPATAARMYDYFLGGFHNFPADEEAARAVVARLPDVPMGARANRAFLTRAVRFLVDTGVRQFLDIGSGIPTQGNVHEIAQGAAPTSRVLYVDIDPVAVDESLQLLDGNTRATAILGDLRDPNTIVNHPAAQRTLDFTQPIALLLAAVLHFIPDDEQAQDIVRRLTDALPPRSYVLISHAAAETFQRAASGSVAAAEVYRQRTATPGTARTREAVERFLADLNLVEPGVVWLHHWHPDPNEPAPTALTTDPARSGGWAALGKKV